MLIHPIFPVLEQSRNGIATRVEVMSKSADFSRPPEYVIEHSGRALLGRLPLIRGEDGCAYNELCARVAAAVNPKDFVEEIWVRDVADLSWEVFRLRRIKAKLWTSQVAAAIRCTLQGVCSEAQANKLSREWETGAIGTDRPARGHRPHSRVNNRRRLLGKRRKA